MTYIEDRPAMNWTDRIAHYAKATKYPPCMTVAEGGTVYGMWVMGNSYKVASGYYGGYPATYLARVKALFPDKTRALHLFSGRVDLKVFPGDTVDLDASNEPTFIDDAQSLRNVPLENYDIVLADPPYSVEDAEHYQPSMVKRNKVFRALTFLKPGAHVVWLDQVLPMYTKRDFALEAQIGMVKSTNHRFRVVSIWRKITDPADDL